MKLTPTQERSLGKIRDRGVWVSGDGIRLSTVRALERHGLVTLDAEWVGWTARPFPEER